MRSFIARHKALVGVTTALAVGLVVFVLLWFQPQKLIIEKKVNEALPVATTAASASASPRDIAGGEFRSLEHRTTGRARLVRLADGSIILRFDHLDTSNGPVLHVYLSELPSTLGQNDYGRRYIDLGGLKGNQGSQNYAVPAETDLSRFHSVVIWCTRFHVGFGVAPLA